jgi:hypothetical protein
MIFPHQKKAYDELIKTMAAHTLASKYDIKPRPRLSRIVVGPTGSGKSYIARNAAKAAGWPIFPMNVSGWIIEGARQEPTWKHLLEWAAGLDDKQTGLIVLDEVDKIWGTESWSQHLRAELYSLLDGGVPPSMTEYEFHGRRWEIPEMEEILSRHLIVACGAFQESLGSDKIGFGTEPDEPSQNELSKHLQKELINRFHGEIVKLPLLTRADYAEMVMSLKESMSPQIFERVLDLSANKIDDAVRDQQGARFVECLVTDVLLRIADTEGSWKLLADQKKMLLDARESHEEIIKAALRDAEATLKEDEPV